MPNIHDFIKLYNIMNANILKIKNLVYEINQTNSEYINQIKYKNLFLKSFNIFKSIIDLKNYGSIIISDSLNNITYYKIDILTTNVINECFNKIDIFNYELIDIINSLNTIVNFLYSSKK